jgi:hypothetical protein
MAVWSTVNLRRLSAPMRLDAEHYKPEYLSFARLVARGDALGELVSAIIHPVELTREYEDAGVPILLAQNIRRNRLSFGVQAFMGERFRAILARNEILPGDVVMTRSGANFGDAAAYLKAPPGSKEYFACADCLIIRPRGVRCGYLSTYLNTAVGRSLLTRGAYGAAQPHIAPPYLRTLRIPRLGQLESNVHDEVARAAKLIEQSSVASAAAEKILLRALELDDATDNFVRYCTRPFTELLKARRFDAEYFSTQYQRALSKLGKGGRTLGEVAVLAERRLDVSQFGREDVLNYIEIGSLSGDGQTESETINLADIPSRAQWVVRAGDVITSTVRPVRRLSAIISETQDGFVCSSGFAVLAPKRGEDAVEPEVLLTYLRLPVICGLLDLNTTASMYPAIPVDRLLSIPILLPPKGVRVSIVEKIRESFGARREATRLLEKAKKTVEDEICGNLRQSSNGPVKASAQSRRV